jgi:hypothetical protein
VEVALENDLGPLNGHAVGRILKEPVRRAAVAIHSERFLFTPQAKQSYSGAKDDVVTSADRKAQDICCPGRPSSLRLDRRHQR